MAHRLALLIGNRFNPWHFRAYHQLAGQPSVTVFRAESEIQRYFDERDDGSAAFAFERMFFDTQAGAPWTRCVNGLRARYGGRTPGIVPFHERLRGFDLIQTWELFTDWSEQAIEARERYGVPVVTMVWDNLLFNMERTPRERAIKQRVLAASDRFIVHSERSRRMLLLEGVDASRVALVPPGVDTQTFCPGAAKRQRFGLNDDDFVILFVGWFLPRKGIDFLLPAVRELIDEPGLRGRRVRLLAIGSGPGQDRVKALAARLNLSEHCVFAGSLPYGEMPEAFRAADVFVLPSIATPEWQEQFGMALIEAMACGTPCVATYSGAVPEITGDAAVLCQPNDFVSLSGALKALASDDARRADLADAGRTRAVECFDLSRLARGLDQVYADVLQQRARG